MKQIEIDNGCKIFSWCPDVEEEALDQMKIISRLPFVKHVALMPDGHLGQNMCIGGVVACENVVVPDFVGCDIGCGMGAIKTSIKKDEIEDEVVRKRILHSLSRGIPVGFAHNSQKRANEIKNDLSKEVDALINKSGIENGNILEHNPIGHVYKTVYDQLGTLGGGNHFCEVQYDQDDNVWIMLHSGSRNIGKKVGDYFNELAQELNSKWYSKCDAIPFLPTNTEEGKAYLAWMDYSLRFAYLNRKVMLDEVKRTFEHEFTDIKFVTSQDFEDTNEDILNIHHNFASLENHLGKNYWIHRKGATMARDGMTGIIPGSMGTGSYIVKGLGNITSLTSCSHGAGRKMGRMAFSRQMQDKYDEIEKSLEGVIHLGFGEFERGKMKGVKDVSEAPGAYKDIESVMSNQTDLVKPVVHLKPLICLKG